MKGHGLVMRAMSRTMATTIIIRMRMRTYSAAVNDDGDDDG